MKIGKARSDIDLTTGLRSHELARNFATISSAHASIAPKRLEDTRKQVRARAAPRRALPAAADSSLPPAVLPELGQEFPRAVERDRAERQHDQRAAHRQGQHQGAEAGRQHQPRQGEGGLLHLPLPAPLQLPERHPRLLPGDPDSFTRFRPYLAHFPPVFSRFLRVFTVSTRRFQRAQNRNPGPRNSVKGAQTPF